MWGGGRRVKRRKPQSKGRGRERAGGRRAAAAEAREENAGRLAGVRGDDGVAPRARALTPLGLGVISTVLSILLPPPPLGSGVPVATRGASLPTAGALPARTERMHCSLAQWRALCPDTEAGEPLLCSSAAAGASFVSAISAPLSPPLPPDSPPLPTSAEPSVQTLRQREEGGPGPSRGRGCGSVSVPWVCGPLRYKGGGGGKDPEG